MVQYEPDALYKPMKDIITFIEYSEKFSILLQNWNFRLNRRICDVGNTLYINEGDSELLRNTKRLS
jgi:hypothetical protein